MSKYYYNGVLLPEIPADVLAEYPYAWIGKHEKKGQYQLFLSKYQWWYDVNKDTIRCANDTNLMNTKVIWYTIDVSTADTATEWIFYSDTDKTFSLNSRPVFWSSHNIKKNSEDSTEIYFYGSEPVDSNEPEEPDVFYKVNGNRLTKIANAIREKTGKPYPMTLEQMPTEIASITGGSDITLIDNIDITPDFSLGNQIIVAQEGYAVKGATILKPETLIPENIADGVEIAGIIGSLIAGTGGSGSALQFANGSFNTGTTGVERVTITHGKNVMPDFIAVWKTGIATMDASTRPFMSAWGMKSKFASGPQAAICCAGYAMAENDNGIDNATTSQQNSGYIFCPNETTFQVGRVDSGNGQCLFVPNSAYNWIAIYGMGGGGGSSADVRYVTFMNGTEVLYKKPVAVGDDCVDVLQKGLIETPTKESDVQYNYTYYGWGASDGGAADANILKNITEDKSVYAIYTSTLREYTITYLDSDGVTVLKTEQLPYGTVPSYVPTSSSGIFQEWFPAPTAVTGNASYKAVWSAAIVVIPQTTITVRTDGTSGIGTAGSATEDFVWGAKYRLTVDGETSEWVATQYYTTFADGNKFVTSGIGNPWARTNRNGSAVTAHRLNSHTGPTVSDTGEKFFAGISGPSTTGQYTASLYAKKAGTYTISVVKIPG